MMLGSMPRSQRDPPLPSPNSQKAKVGRKQKKIQMENNLPSRFLFPLCKPNDLYSPFIINLPTSQNKQEIIKKQPNTPVHNHQIRQKAILKQVMGIPFILKGSINNTSLLRQGNYAVGEQEQVNQLCRLHTHPFILLDCYFVTLTYYYPFQFGRSLICRGFFFLFRQGSVTYIDPTKDLQRQHQTRINSKTNKEYQMTPIIIPPSCRKIIQPVEIAITIRKLATTNVQNLLLLFSFPLIQSISNFLSQKQRAKPTYLCLHIQQ